MIELASHAGGSRANHAGRSIQSLALLQASHITDRDMESDSDQDIDVDDISDDDDARSPIDIRPDSRASSGSHAEHGSHCDSTADTEHRARPGKRAPKLSFGISQILGGDDDRANDDDVEDDDDDDDGSPISKCRDGEREFHYREGHPAMGLGMLGGGLGYGLFAGGHFGMLPFGPIPGFPQGVIKVPAHRPPFGPGMPAMHMPGAVPNMMFPWMQERKDRLTGKY